MDDLRWFVNRKNKKSVKNHMSRAEIRRVVLAYLEKFFSTLILYKEFPVKQQLYVNIWKHDFYEQLNDEEKIEIYNKLKQNDNGN